MNVEDANREVQGERRDESQKVQRNSDAVTLPEGEGTGWHVTPAVPVPALPDGDEESVAASPDVGFDQSSGEVASATETDDQPTQDEVVSQGVELVDGPICGNGPAREGEADAREGEGGEPERPRIVLKAGTDAESLRALALCREKVQQLRLRMHPLAARWDDDRHVTIFFRADDKVDFRKLVRELSYVLRARIELRQVGPREQGKLCGLVGKCGYELCCRTFLPQFAQSSIKMAKVQDLALNPMKISGICGRLLCCLNYEQQLYAEVKSHMPRMNRIVDTEFGQGRVVGLNVLKNTVTVQFETATRELSPDEVRLAEGQS